MDAPLSVKALLEQLKRKVEAAYASVCVVGEVSNFRGSGRHWYFTLKEEGAALQCAVWAGQQRSLRHIPKDGQRVVLNGSLNVYVAGGSLTLAVTQCELTGVGDLQQRLRELEAKLRSEGLFDRPKRPLPRIPKRLGIVAALGGAALQDVLKVTARRAPGVDLLIAPAAAQGERCVPENLMALQEIQDAHWGCDAVLIIRGGGSLEDLWGFNDPELVRAVAECRIPVITGVGHEIDTTLVDLASDRRAATPSQAAELATPDLAQLSSELQRRVLMLEKALDWRLRGYESTLNLLMDSEGMRAVPQRLMQLNGRLATMDARLQGAHPRKRLELSTQRLMALRHRLGRTMEALGEADRPRLALALRRMLPAVDRRLSRADQRLAVLAERLKGLDPKSPMQRGFVLALTPEGKPLTSAAQAQAGDLLKLQWLDGEHRARVEE
jgi:exodeoxyribonuclease VII large subunit